ncbi:maltokinase N-terminal cap-like domain-containing protein [Streptomyces sp. KLOTTS4A1]|uniref:maltokinase N-terminal cap-like domain-containing protein n=1 Tax=Streptomyces sp. KLOTTS4A1 TaxID=3390996 RepID=UPI0039F44901
MAEIHRTTLKPTKLELLADWLPGRPWYGGGPDIPQLAKAGGFRLDDPEGEVGIEFMVVTVADRAYLAPMTYRGAPLEGAEDALIGTSEHGVLGTRWLYDGCHDPVFAAELAALFEGRVRPQAQSISDQEDREVHVAYEGGPLGEARIEKVTDTGDATEMHLTGGAVLRLARVLEPGTEAGTSKTAGRAAGQVTAVWHQSDETPSARTAFVTLHVGG